jgi:hypothetical protein
MCSSACCLALCVYVHGLFLCVCVRVEHNVRESAAACCLALCVYAHVLFLYVCTCMCICVYMSIM